MTTIATTDRELRGLLAFAHSNPTASNLHGIIVDGARLAATDGRVLAILGDPEPPWHDRSLIPYRAIAAACVDHDEWSEWSEYARVDGVLIRVGAKSYSIERGDIKITCDRTDVLGPDVGAVVHGPRADEDVQLIDARVFGKLEAIASEWRMERAGAVEPVRFRSKDGRWTAFAMPMKDAR